jgi:hypothetical protein
MSVATKVHKFTELIKYWNSQKIKIITQNNPVQIHISFSDILGGVQKWNSSVETATPNVNQ